jgi:hypothetical protein
MPTATMSLVQRWRVRLVTLFGLWGAWGLAAPASASPIKYQLIIPNATAHFGSQTYANVHVTFTFVGDDTNVVSGTTSAGIPGVPDISYSAIYQGVASVTVGGPAPVLASAFFSPNQIVVTVDHNNEGVGFGFVPGGVGASGFDVTQLQPIYPGSISDYQTFPGFTQTPPGWKGYDLTLAYPKNHTNYFGGEFHADGSVDIAAAVYSCNQFNGSIFYTSCASPAPIQTDRGAFTIDRIDEPTLTGVGVVNIGEFTAASAPPGVPSPPSGLSGTVE